MSNFDFSLNGWNQFLATSGGRDKLGKFVHYGAMSVAGVAADLKASYPKGSSEQQLAQFVHEKARSLYVRIMDSRRTMRWLTGISVLVALRKPCPWESKPAFYIAQLTLLFWQVTDHIRWLQQIGWLSGDQLKLKRIGFTGFLISASVSFLYNLGIYSRLEGDKNEQKRNATLREVIKHFLTVICCLHISEIQVLHDAICGAAGATASCIDIYNTFPRKG